MLCWKMFIKGIQFMFAHRIETKVAQNGMLNLQGLPFSEGEIIEVIILRQENTKQVKNEQRTVGEYSGKIRMSEDFAEPLPDEFWLGKSE